MISPLSWVLRSELLCSLLHIIIYLQQDRRQMVFNTISSVLRTMSGTWQMFNNCWICLPMSFAFSFNLGKSLAPEPDPPISYGDLLLHPEASVALKKKWEPLWGGRAKEGARRGSIEGQGPELQLLRMHRSMSGTQGNRKTCSKR